MHTNARNAYIIHVIRIRLSLCYEVSAIPSLVLFMSSRSLLTFACHQGESNCHLQGLGDVSFDAARLGLLPAGAAARGLREGTEA